ncbi:MAG TPA: RnfABCDGE type electron transport complex subunit A [Spirochaetales bacterium]|nr:RnfABCDGE type electron transport complex subunit A [Spirochaetales bacterium]HOV38844.1 RnfABCDGE type electron transport complex subunit A [Spirochaetales bacterium]
MPVALKIFISALLINNIILMRFIALCPYIGMSTDVKQSIGMGFAVTFVMVMASTVTWALYHFVLLPLGLEFLQILVFILIIASLVQLVEYYLKKSAPALYLSMGIYLPLITTNCAILAVTFDNITAAYTFFQSIVYSIGVALGFTLAMVLLAGLRNRIRTAAIPPFLRGNPILFVLSSLVAVSFMGFAGLIK